MKRVLTVFTASALAFVVGTAALAIPGSIQNPDGSWTGPGGEDLGGGPKPDPKPHDYGWKDKEGRLPSWKRQSPAYDTCCVRSGERYYTYRLEVDKQRAARDCRRLLKPPICYK